MHEHTQKGATDMPSCLGHKGLRNADAADNGHECLLHPTAKHNRTGKYDQALLDLPVKLRRLHDNCHCSPITGADTAALLTGAIPNTSTNRPER